MKDLSKGALYIPFDKDNIEGVNEYIRSLDNDVRRLYMFANARVRFGDGTDGTQENISGIFSVFTSNAVADTEDTIAHGLGVAPVGFIVVNKNKAGNLYDSGTAWTSTNAYLKSDTASTTYTVFFLK